MLEYTIAGFMPVVLAAVVATLMTRASFGDEPVLLIESISMTSIEEVFFVALIGFFCGGAAALFVKIQSTCMKYSHITPLIRFGLIGLVTGCAGVLVPQVLGLGYDTLQATLLNNVSFSVLAAVIACKLFVTAFACGLGMPLGYIGPALIIGAGIGSLLGIVGIEAMPELASDRTLYVLLGMGAMMGALLNAPVSYTHLTLPTTPYV